MLDHPLESKSLRPFNSAGVYMFLSSTGSQSKRRLAAGKGILSVLKDDLHILYVGKAKQLNQRLQNYRRAGSSSAGEWQKAATLREEARSVLIIPTPTHFEACLLELFLIRVLQPQLNYTSTSAGRIHFVLQDPENRRISVSTRKKTGMKVWGLVRARSQARLAFAALSEGLDGFNEQSEEVCIQPFYSKFGKSGSNRLIVDVPAKFDGLCKSFLKGARNGLLRALWQAMKKAADAQQFHLAAQMRDRYLALRELQFQLRRSRRIMRCLRKTTVELPAFDAVPQRSFFVERFTITRFAAQPANEAQCAPIAYVQLFNDLIGEFGTELADANEIERLRVNFEFLRLMLLWAGKRRDSVPEGS